MMHYTTTGTPREIRQRLLCPPNAMPDPWCADIKVPSRVTFNPPIPPSLVVCIDAIPSRRRTKLLKKVEAPVAADAGERAAQDVMQHDVVVELTPVLVRVLAEEQAKTMEPPPSIPFRWRRAVTVVARGFNLRCDHIYGLSRIAPIVIARQTAMYLVREIFKRSFPEVGRVFRRDHTTVLHAHQQISRKIERDPLFAAKVAALRAEIEVEDGHDHPV